MKGMCINWKVVAGLAAIGLGITLVVPGAGAVALPVLLAAACPLSMVLMMRRSGDKGSCSSRGKRSPGALLSREKRLAELESELAELRTAAQRGADGNASPAAAVVPPATTASALDGDRRG